MSFPFGAKQPDSFHFPRVEKKAVVAAFDGGQITSDGGVLLLAAVERELGIADMLAGLIDDPRKQAYVTHSVSDILRARILAIACGYEDGNDLDMLRTDPGFKLACGKLPQLAKIFAHSRRFRAGKTHRHCGKWYEWVTQ
jgi:hypothetical protein